MGWKIEDEWWTEVGGMRRFKVAASDTDRAIGNYWRPDVWWEHLQTLLEKVRLHTGQGIVCSYEGPRGFINIGSGDNFHSIRVDWIRSNVAVCGIVCLFAAKEISEGRWR